MNNKETYYVWADSDFHSTYAVCASYKEALRKKKEMKSCLYGDYKFSIKKNVKSKKR